MYALKIHKLYDLLYKVTYIIYPARIITSIFDSFESSIFTLNFKLFSREVKSIFKVGKKNINKNFRYSKK